MYIWRVKWSIFLSILFLTKLSRAQDSLLLPSVNATQIAFENTASDSVPPLNKNRFYFVAGIHASSYAATLLLLSETWYKDHPRTSFHVFNDSKEWLQVDKVGHSWTAYNLARYSTGLWRWTGMEPQKALIYGGVSALGYQTILEFLDAHSAEWGWSWSDIAANVGGTGLYTFQELAWKEQRLQFKFSSHTVAYESQLRPRVDQLYGKTLPEKILKDYNGQTYWLSMNLHSFAKESKLPRWLNVAVGYGAKGLLGGFDNIGRDKNNQVFFDRSDIPRRRQWYLAPDIDFTKIKTNKESLRIAFKILNMLKFPAPTLEFSNGKIKGHLLYF